MKEADVKFNRALEILKIYEETMED